MLGGYVYFISTLPFLQFGAKPPFAFENFLALCGEQLSPEDAAVIASVPNIEAGNSATVKDFIEGAPLQPALAKWRAFDTALRNELARIRGGRKRTESKYIRGDGYTDPSLSAAVMKARRNPSVLEGERTLDMERWRALDDMGVGHHFDIDVLVIYAVKLIIMNKWEAVRAADKDHMVESALSGASAKALQQQSA